MWESPQDRESFRVDPEDVVVTGVELLVTSGNTVVGIDLASGATRSTAEIADVDLVPLGIVDGIAVVGARSTRGTASWSVRGVELATGAVAWTLELEAGQRLEPGRPFTIGDTWTAALTRAGVSVLEYRDDSDELVVQNVAPATGVTTGPFRIELAEPDPVPSISLYGWAGDHLYAENGGTFVVVDPASGTIVDEGP